MTDVNVQIDELADLCERWKGHRSAGRTPRHIRDGIVQLVCEIAEVDDDYEAPLYLPLEERQAAQKALTLRYRGILDNLTRDKS